MVLRFFLAGLLLLTALGLGLIGYQATRMPTIVVAPSVAEAPPAPLTVDVLVAAHNLPAGTLIKEDDFTPRPLAVAAIPKGAMTNGPSVIASLRGGLLRRYLEAGSNLMADDVLHPRDRGFLAAVLTPGARAISIGVDAISGDGGLIWPGDKVDVILTQELSDKDAPLARRFVGETILSGVRVVAVDQSITQGAVLASDNATGRLARTVTLEVTPAQAERTAVAERLGRLTLAIRAVDGEPEVNGTRAAMYGGDVSAALAAGGKSDALRMRVIEGGAARDVMFQ